ncbi:MAG TPA: PQQ-binding-like beta-propeller repeat protein [Capillimicrobium sp.]|nr:PQQ-binding-like beta-propeller repeat protein [Capillimicrobium sp.]
MRAFLRRKPVLIALAVIAVLAAGAGVAAYLLVVKEPGDVSNPDVAFDAPDDRGDAKPDGKDRKDRKPSKPALPPRENWPRYGYTPAHTRAFQPERPINGPFRRVWKRGTGALAEFPPAIYDGTLYQLIDDGKLLAIDTDTGKTRWKRHIGKLAASTPAVDERRIFAVLLEGGHTPGRGKVVALQRRNGRKIWSRHLTSRAESSPLLHRGRVYFGSENGTLYCLDAKTGREIWTYQAAGAIKGSPSLSDGVLYFGNYGGDVQAVRASNGHLLWRNGVARGTLRSGNFYATAAVAFGRVYIGATDGREYSLSAQTGELAWARQTGGYIYASAAVDDVEGLGPTVFVGSYDRNLHAFDAKTGETRWTASAPGRISGSPTIVGSTIYFADLDQRYTTGVKTRTGRRVYQRKPGYFDPIVSDGRRLYQTGGYSVHAFEPIRERRQAERTRADGKRAERQGRQRSKKPAKRRDRRRGG